MYSIFARIKYHSEDFIFHCTRKQELWILCAMLIKYDWHFCVMCNGYYYDANWLGIDKEYKKFYTSHKQMLEFLASEYDKSTQ